LPSLSVPYSPQLLTIMRHHQSFLPAFIASLLTLSHAAPHPSNTTSSASASPSSHPHRYAPAPKGGVGVSPADPPPAYAPASEFDTQSLQLACYQEFIELDLFHHGLAQFANEEFDSAGIDESQRYLIQFWAEQEVGHATAINNMLGDSGTVEMCNYSYPFDSVRDFIDFSQVLTRWGEAGVYGFLPHLNSRPAAQILLQSITTEAKQQEGLAMMEGLFPTPYWFNMGLPQAYAWTLLVQYISSCPASNPRINFNVFPLLYIQNQPNATGGEESRSAISSNNTQLWSPGDQLDLAWDPVGKEVGPKEQGGYATAVNETAGKPKFAAFIHQLNVTYVPLENVNMTARTATTAFPDFKMFNSTNGPNVNGTVFVSLTDDDVYLTPYNLSLINDHTLALGWLHA
jgi:hypothetical protein